MEIVRLLVQAQADPSVQGGAEKTAVEEAKALGYEEMVEFFHKQETQDGAHVFFSGAHLSWEERRYDANTGASRIIPGVEEESYCASRCGRGRHEIELPARTRYESGWYRWGVPFWFAHRSVCANTRS